VVRAEDTLLGEQVEVEADLAVLAVGMQPRQERTCWRRHSTLCAVRMAIFRNNTPSCARSRATCREFSWRLLPGTEDIPDTVAHAKAAASAAMILMSQKGAGYASN